MMPPAHLRDPLFETEAREARTTMHLEQPTAELEASEEQGDDSQFDWDDEWAYESEDGIAFSDWDARR
eukprot:8254102-Heterocapsa_arctica.AAC.1